MGFQDGTGLKQASPSFLQNLEELALGIDWTDKDGRFFGTHHCGPGGSGDAVNGLDRDCQEHDECYDLHALKIRDNSNPFLSPYDQGWIHYCNQNLCNEARQSSDDGANEVYSYFTHVGVAAVRCH